MDKIHINKNQFSDLLNLRNNVFYPLKNFVSEKEFRNIINNKEYYNQYFPFPITFGVNKYVYSKIKNKRTFDLYYKNKYLINIYNVNFFNLDKKKFFKKIYGFNYVRHPYYKKFISENFRFMHFNFRNESKKNLKHRHFISPFLFKKRLESMKIFRLASFHTRNVPHKAHQWIHSYLYKKFGALLIQPLIGQYKKGEYTDDLIMKSNKLAAKFFNSNKVLSIPFFSYPRYAGYREAALHAIVRKNYGCTHFWIGRDHAGYKNFYGYKRSQNYCYKNQKKLRIKIIAGAEPFYCENCKTIKNIKCTRKKCSKTKVIKISGSLIRKMIKENKTIPEYLMDPKISKLLSSKSLIS